MRTFPLGLVQERATVRHMWCAAVGTVYVCNFGYWLSKLPMADTDLVLLFIKCQTLHTSCIACVLVCEAVLLFTLAAGRRLAELELVLFLVQVCVPMSIAKLYVCM